MKKRIALLLLCLFAACLLVACNEHTHTWGDWVETKAPTCTEKGIEVRICDCGEDEMRYMEAPGAHVPATEWMSDATTHRYECTICGYIGEEAHEYDSENTCVCTRYKDEGVQFTLQNGTYTVTDYTGSAAEVIIPSQYKGVSVTSIGIAAFYDCTSLTSVVIPDSVTSIGNYAFCYCDSLTSVVIPDSVTSIGKYAFQGCRSLASVVIPDSVTSISACAFYECTSLTSTVIPDSVTAIGDDAFYYCESLTSIKYRGTQAQWNAITKGNNWNYNTGNYTITYNYAGD